MSSQSQSPTVVITVHLDPALFEGTTSFALKRRQIGACRRFDLFAPRYRSEQPVVSVRAGDSVSWGDLCEGCGHTVFEPKLTKAELKSPSPSGKLLRSAPPAFRVLELPLHF